MNTTIFRTVAFASVIAAVVLAGPGGSLRFAGSVAKTRETTRLPDTASMDRNAGVVHGTVVDAKTGAPIKGAYVRCDGSTTTRADGAYTVYPDLWPEMLHQAIRANPSLRGKDYTSWPKSELDALNRSRRSVKQKLVVMANGYEPFSATVNATAGGIMEFDVRLAARARSRRSNKAVWNDATAAVGIKVLQPTYIPQGFAVAAEFDGGFRGSPFAGANPRTDGEDACAVQYNNGNNTIIVHCGTVGDLGGVPTQSVRVRRTQAQMASSAGVCLVTWSEGCVRYTVEGMGAPTIIAEANILRVARSME